METPGNRPPGIITDYREYHGSVQCGEDGQFPSCVLCSKSMQGALGGFGDLKGNWAHFQCAIDWNKAHASGRV